jgi:hypothetical protein
VRGEERFLAIKSFNENTKSFVFLLSTRAGGLGLNLTAAGNATPLCSPHTAATTDQPDADTVIFLDSDWNPQMDLQAMARAHRLGQTRDVQVFRLIARHSIDEVILRRAMRKLALATDVVEKGRLGADTAHADELKAMITYGLRDMCDDSSSSVADADIERILREGKASDSCCSWNVGGSDELRAHTQDMNKLYELPAAVRAAAAAPAAAAAADQPAAAEDNMYLYEGTDYSVRAHCPPVLPVSPAYMSPALGPPCVRSGCARPHRQDRCRHCCCCRPGRPDRAWQ